MVYLVVGIDRSTLVRWHGNVIAASVSAAEHIARGRAATQGVQLVVAAVIGPYASIVSDAAQAWANASEAA